jgi:hypothetical protein
MYKARAASCSVGGAVADVPADATAYAQGCGNGYRGVDDHSR